MIIGAYRPARVALGREGERHPLESTLNKIKRYFGDVWIELGETPPEGRAFVDALLDHEPNRLDDDFCTRLHRHTAGHPLFTIALLRAMQERGDIVQDADRYWVETATLDWGTLPAKVEGVIEERIGRLEEELLGILTVASVEGEEFTVQNCPIRPYPLSTVSLRQPQCRRAKTPARRDRRVIGETPRRPSGGNRSSARPPRASTSRWAPVSMHSVVSLTGQHSCVRRRTRSWLPTAGRRKSGPATNILTLPAVDGRGRVRSRETTPTGSPYEAPPWY